MANRTHQYLLDQLAPKLAVSGFPERLDIQRFSDDRMFNTVVPSGGCKEFKPGDIGRLAIAGLSQDPVAAYVLFARDPASLNQRLWDLPWGETVLWLPSPRVPVRDDKGELVLLEPQPVRAVPGRFIVTAFLILDREVLPKLDRRWTNAVGPPPQPEDLDEADTCRFLYKARSLTKRRRGAPAPLAVATDEYVVSV